MRGLVDIKSSVVSAMAVMGALAGVGYTLNKVYQQTVGVFEDYALSVSDLSRLTGANMAETSRMIQVADDMRISYEGLQKALWFASKNGVEVNIESLARLADKYNGFNSATEKATFLAKTFGKSGEEMGRMMSLGAQGIRENAAAVEKGLIINERGEAAAHWRNRHWRRPSGARWYRQGPEGRAALRRQRRSLRLRRPASRDRRGYHVYRASDVQSSGNGGYCATRLSRG